MAVIQANQTDTLAEINKMAGNIEIGNMLAEFAQENTFLDEVPWFPTTHGSYSEEYRAKSLGKGAFTKLNAGVPQLGSSGDIFKETTRLYEGESLIDIRELKAADDAARVRFVRDKLNMEGAFEDFNFQLMYGNSASNPDAIKSFTERRPAVDDKYCFSAGGAGTDLTSVWLVELSFKGVHMLYPKSTSPGFKFQDYGEKYIPAPDGNGNYTVLVSHYEIYGGLAFGVEASCMRYCNIATDPDDTAHHYDPDILITRMKPYLPTRGGSRAILFAPRSIYGQIEKHAYDKVNASYSRSDIEGFGTLLKIVGIPVRPWDTISEHESVVPAA